ncbi:hypothetical protein [Parasitella parasitica]|uniref:Uncharacterized protein n=1 Tax=Parasitella parasitica TaxID=35722 RepID=A0A0B7N9V6_9FUNG|nr:hypothetical protein [Parasitella parasitica]
MFPSFSKSAASSLNIPLYHMLSQYQELLDKRRLQRKRGNKPLPELPPFKVLPRDQYHEDEPSSPADSVFGSSQSQRFREPFVLNPRSPSVQSRQSVSEASSPPASHRIFTPPPIASIHSTIEQNQNPPSTINTSRYLPYLTPFSVTPRKRMYAESFITVNEAEETVTSKRAQLHNSEIEEDAATNTYLMQNVEKQNVGNDRSAMDHADLIDEDLGDLSIHDLPLDDGNHIDSREKDQPTALPSLARSPSVHSIHLDPNSGYNARKSATPEEEENTQSVKSSHISKNNNDGTPDPPVSKGSRQDQENDSKLAESNRGSIEATTGEAQYELNEALIAKEPKDTGKQVDRAIQEEPVQRSFDDDNIEYGDLDGDYYGQEFNVADSIHEADQGDLDEDCYNQESNVADPIQEADQGEATKQGIEAKTPNEAEPAKEPLNDAERSPNDVLKDLRKMATANTVNLTKRMNLAQVHIKTISSTVSQISDAHEKSIIEDYYYTLNDDLKKYYKSYTRYEQLASARRRLLGFYRKKDQQFLGEIKEERSLRKHIDDLKEKITELDAKLSTQRNIQDIFFEIHRIKESSTVTKEASKSSAPQ